MDRLRLRMAITVGPIAPAPLGYDGPTIIECHRLLDCDAVRGAIRDDPTTDLAVIVSDTVHAYFVRPRYQDLDPNHFVQVVAVVRNFQQPAWLWRPESLAAALAG